MPLPAQIGPNWTFKNKAITTGGNELGIGVAVTEPNGTGVLEHVYIHSNKMSEKPAIWVNPKKHRGHLIIREVNVSGHSDNAIYAETAPPHGAGGTITIENSYLHDNDRGHARVSGGTTLRNLHIHNTNNDPTHRYTSVGFFSWYAGRGTVTARDCHVDVTPQNTRGGAKAVRVLSRGPKWNINDSQVRGSVDDSGGNVTFRNRGQSPQIAPPKGVPMSAEEARNGTSSATGEALPPTEGAPEGADGGGGDGDESLTGGSAAPTFEEVTVGFDDIPENLEPPATKLTVNAKVTQATWKELNGLRDREEPMDISIGRFALEDVGITDLTLNAAGDESGYDVSVTLQEHRVTYIQRPDVNEGDEESEETDRDREDILDRYTDPDTEEVPTPEYEGVVNLGDEGLEAGDEIGPLLEEHLESGTRVIVPPGTYTLADPTDLGGTYRDAALVGDGGQAILETPSETAVGANITVNGGEGSFRLDRITLSGPRNDSANAALSVGVTNDDGSALFNRVFLPDGASGRARGITAAGDHRGTLFVRNSSAHRFPGGGVTNEGCNGRMVIEGGLYKNNATANIRLCGNDSRMDMVTSANDAPGPQFNGSRTRARGLWFSGNGNGMVVNECDFYHDVSNGAAIEASAGASMSGTVRDSRITNQRDQPAAVIKNDITFDGVHVTGDGSTDLVGAGAACTGPTCTRADYAPPSTTQDVSLDVDAESFGVETDEDGTVNADVQATTDPTVPTDIAPYIVSMPVEELDRDEVRRVTLGDTQIHENIVYDQSADGARIEFDANGSGWTLRNIAILGEPSGGGQTTLIEAQTPAGATGTIENVYMPDGAPPRSGVTGIRAHPAHAGTLTIRNVNVQNFPDSGVRAHGSSAGDAGGGDTTIESSYIAYNGVADVTLGTGDALTTSVVYTDGTGPTATGAYRGVWGWYGASTVTDSEVFTARAAGTAIAANHHGSSVTATGGNVEGDITANVTLTTGIHAETQIPNSVPTSPMSAAGQD